MKNVLRLVKQLFCRHQLRWFAETSDGHVVMHCRRCGQLVQKSRTVAKLFEGEQRRYGYNEYGPRLM